MQGSFTPDSAEKFLELMREAGYETSVLPASDGLQNFSELGINPGATQGDVWSGNVADFGEVRGEYIENYDYTRCVRPNGTAYGTGGTCRQGTPAEKEEHDALSQLQSMLPKGEKIVTSSGKVFGSQTEKKKPSATPTAQEITSMNRDDLYDGKAVHRPGTEGHQAYKNEIERRHKLVDGLKKRGMSDEEIEKAVWNREAKKAGGREVDSEQIATAPVPPKPIKDPVPGILRSQAEVKKIIADRPETPNAIRDEMGRPLKLSPDRLKALSQEDLEKEWNRASTASRRDPLRREIDRREAESKKDPTEVAKDRWQEDREKTYNGLKGKSKEEVLSKLGQHQQIHGLTVKDSLIDLKNAVVSAIHGNTAPGEQSQRMKNTLQKKARLELESMKAKLLETSNKIDKIVNSGGKVGRNDPLSKKLREQAAAIAELKKTNFSEGAEGSYDFTRCVRPDGSAYGTRGKCKKGTEAGAKEKEKPRTKGGQKRRKTAEMKAEAKAASLRAAGEKRSAGAARTRLFKEEVEKVREKMRGASPEEQNRLLQEASRKADERSRVTATPGMTAQAVGRSRKPATPQEARDTWAKAEVAVKSAKANAAKVNKETKGDKSPAARDRRFAANQALDRAEMAALRAQDKFHAATKRQSKAAMTPEQRQEERTAGK
jgi:hypothetical protein